VAAIFPVRIGNFASGLRGRNVHFPHPSGIVIGAGVVVEDDAWIYRTSPSAATARRRRQAVSRRRPGARIYAGAKVLGGIRVGAGAVVGANSVALRDVPDGATVVGLPARAVEP
jgi:serine O-acetyltransferase